MAQSFVILFASDIFFDHPLIDSVGANYDFNLRISQAQWKADSMRLRAAPCSYVET